MRWIVILTLSIGCSDAGLPPLISDSDAAPTRDEDAAFVAIPPCASPAPGCPCADAGEKVDCGRVYRIVGDYVTCSEGFMKCEKDGTWSTCIGDSIYDGGR